MTPTDTFARDLEALLPSPVPPRIGIAVSGGGDSMALMYLAAAWAGTHGVALLVCTIDHGLRPEAGVEAAWVCGQARALGLECSVREWHGHADGGNLQDAARRARYDLIAAWAAERSVEHVLLGHTLDDQAETVLMRLARGAGVAGLAGIWPSRRDRGVTWLRPLLRCRRDDLRDYVRGRGLEWIDDPSNEDPRFERARVRQVMRQLAALGIDADALAATAERMRTANQVLAEAALAHARKLCIVEHGDVLVEQAALAALPRETRRRILAHIFQWIATSPYPPRQQALESAETVLFEGGTVTLNGCLAVCADNAFRFTREYNAVRDISVEPGEIWDNRWRLSAKAGVTWPPGSRIAALGEGGLTKVRKTGGKSALPRPSLLASPAVWSGRKLLAAPLAGLQGGAAVELLGGEEGFFAALVAH